MRIKRNSVMIERLPCGSVRLQWQSPSGVHKEHELSTRLQEYIDEQSGLPENQNNRNLALRVGIPLAVLLKYQEDMGIDVKRRDRAYRVAIRRAMATTRATGFRVDHSSSDAVPFNPHDLLL